jgi:hypothetical protein
MALFLVKWQQESAGDSDPKPADGQYEVPDSVFHTNLDSDSPYAQWLDGDPADITEAEVRCAQAADYLSGQYGWWPIDGIAEYEKGIGGRDVPPEVGLVEDISDLDDANILPYSVPGLDQYGRRYTMIKKWYAPDVRSVFYLMHIDRTKRPTCYRKRDERYHQWKNIWALRASYTISGVGERQVEPDLTTARDVADKTYSIVSWRECPSLDRLNRTVNKEVQSLADRWRPEEYR